MNRPSRTRTPSPRPRPGRSRRPATLTSAQLTWGAATDNTGVVRYNVHRSTTAGFTPAVGEPDRAADRHELHGSRRRRHLLLPGHRRGRAPATSAPPRTRRPRRSATSRRPGRRERSLPSARSAERRSPGARRPTTSPSSATTSTAAPTRASSPPRRTGSRNRRAPGYVDITVPGTYSYKVTAEDAAGNVGAASNAASATVTADTTAPSAPIRPRRHRRRRDGQLDLDRLDRRRRRRALQRPPRHDGGLHAERREPDRTADGHELRRPRPRQRHLLLQGHRRGRRRQRQRRLERARRDGRGRDSAVGPDRRHRDHAAGSTVNLSWTAATDNVGVARYNVHRGATSGFTPSVVNRIAQPTGHGARGRRRSHPAPTSTS